MSTLVIVLRLVPLLTFAGAMLLSVDRHRPPATARALPNGSGRAPVVANAGAFALYALSLLASSASSASSIALLLASAGSVLGVAGAALVVRSRTVLGQAWSFAPKADQDTGLVITGPYRLVRHPIYLGFALLAMGEAIACASWLALTLILVGIVPTFAWRACAEEQLLDRTFGDRYTVYRQRTRLIIPYVL